jgi:DNA repair photolyase
MFRQATFPLLLALTPSLMPQPGAALGRRLRKAARRGAPLEIGTVADPYDPAGDRYESARSLLSELVRKEGLEISIITRSPGVLYDRDLLVELDKRHAVTLRVLVPSPAERGPLLHAVRTLAAEGIATKLVWAPDISGTGDAEKILPAIFAEAREAEALDVEVEPPVLPRPARERLLATLRRLRLEHGFPRELPGRG